MSSSATFMRSPKARMLVLAALLMVAAGYFASGYLFKEKIEAKRIPAVQIVTFEGLDERAEIEAFLQSDGSVSPLGVEGASLILSAEQRKDFKLPYNITARLKTGEGDYRDLEWSVDREGVRFKVTLDGFRPQDTVNFVYDGSASLTGAHFDWSGRIALEAFLIKHKDMDACVEIASAPAFNVCHTVPGRRVAA